MTSIYLSDSKMDFETIAYVSSTVRSLLCVCLTTNAPKLFDENSPSCQIDRIAIFPVQVFSVYYSEKCLDSQYASVRQSESLNLHLLEKACR